MRSKTLTESFFSDENFKENSIRMQLLQYFIIRSAYTHNNALKPHYDKIKRSRKFFKIEKHVNLDKLISRLKENLKTRENSESPVAITKLEAAKDWRVTTARSKNLNRSTDTIIVSNISYSPTSPEHVLKSRYTFESHHYRKPKPAPVKVHISKKDIIVPIKTSSPYEIKEISIDYNDLISEDTIKDARNIESAQSSRDSKLRISPGRLDSLMKSHKPTQELITLRGTYIPTSPISSTRRTTDSINSTPKVAVNKRPMSQGIYQRRPSSKINSAISERDGSILSSEEISISTPFEPKMTEEIRTYAHSKHYSESSASSYSSLLKLEDMDIKSIYITPKHVNITKESDLTVMTLSDITPEIASLPEVSIIDEVKPDQFNKSQGRESFFKEESFHKRMFSQPKIKTITIIKPQKGNKTPLKGNICKGLAIKPFQRLRSRCIHSIAINI